MHGLNLGNILPKTNRNLGLCKMYIRALSVRMCKPRQRLSAVKGGRMIGLDGVLMNRWFVVVGYIKNFSSIFSLHIYIIYYVQPINATCSC